MGPHTIEALQAQLDQLRNEVDAAKAGRISGTEQAVLEFRIQMLQAMLNEQTADDKPPAKH